MNGRIWNVCMIVDTGVFGCGPTGNDPKLTGRQVLTNSADPDQTMN